MIRPKIIILLALSSISSFTNAQGFYVGAVGGYGLGAARTTYSDYKYVSDGSNQTNTYTVHHKSYGQGLNFGLYTGYMIKKGLGAELGFSYLKGAGFDTKNESENTLFNYSNKTIDHHHGNTMRLLPAMRLNFGEKKLSGYIKAGPVIGLGTKRTIETEFTSSVFGLSQTDYRTLEFTGGLSIGVHSSLGLTYMFSSSIGAFCEIGAIYQQWSPKKSTLTRYEIDGVNQLSSLDTYDKETEYVDEYSLSSTPDPNKPSKATKLFFPFSSIGLNIGIHLTFGKTE